MFAFNRLFPTYGSLNHIYKVGQVTAKGREILMVYNGNSTQKVWRKDYNAQLFPFVVGKEEQL